MAVFFPTVKVKFDVATGEAADLGEYIEDVSNTGEYIGETADAIEIAGKVVGEIAVKVEGTEIFSKKIGPDTAADGWLEVDVDLSKWAGKSVALELVNRPDDWKFEAGYFAKVAIQSR